MASFKYEFHRTNYFNLIESQSRHCCSKNCFINLYECRYFVDLSNHQTLKIRFPNHHFSTTEPYQNPSCYILVVLHLIRDQIYSTVCYLIDRLFYSRSYQNFLHRKSHPLNSILCHQFDQFTISPLAPLLFEFEKHF